MCGKIKACKQKISELKNMKILKKTCKKMNTFFKI